MTAFKKPTQASLLADAARQVAEAKAFADAKRADWDKANARGTFGPGSGPIGVGSRINSSTRS
jgi:hypothetical protein